MLACGAWCAVERRKGFHMSITASRSRAALRGLSAVQGGPVRHPDPMHERPIPSGVSFATGDGSRAEFKISDRLLKSANQLSEQSFFIKTAAAIMAKKPWYTRFVSAITLKLFGQSPREGEGTLEYFEL